MQFPLPYADLTSSPLAIPFLEFFDIGFELIEMMDAVIRDTDGADQAGFLGFGEGTPGAVTRFFATIRCVNQVSIGIKRSG